MEVHIISTCSHPPPPRVLRVRTTCCLLFHQNMHVTVQEHLETLYTAISITVVGLFQAYATRPKGSVGSCIYVSVSWLSAVGQELQISLCK